MPACNGLLHPTCVKWSTEWALVRMRRCPGMANPLLVDEYCRLRCQGSEKLGSLCTQNTCRRVVPSGRRVDHAQHSVRLVGVPWTQDRVRSSGGNLKDVYPSQCGAQQSVWPLQAQPLAPSDATVPSIYARQWCQAMFTAFSRDRQAP